MGQIKLQDVVAATSELTYIAIPRILSRRRPYEWAHPRQMAMAIGRELTTLSLPQIGKYFDRDHTTVLHAIRAVRRRAEKDPLTQSLYDRIKLLSQEYANRRTNPYRQISMERDTFPREAAISGAGSGNAPGYQKSMDE